MMPSNENVALMSTSLSEFEIPYVHIYHTQLGEAKLHVNLKSTSKVKINANTISFNDCDFIK